MSLRKDQIILSLSYGIFFGLSYVAICFLGKFFFSLFNVTLWLPTFVPFFIHSIYVSLLAFCIVHISSIRSSTINEGNFSNRLFPVLIFLFIYLLNFSFFSDTDPLAIIIESSQSFPRLHNTLNGIYSFQLRHFVHLAVPLLLWALISFIYGLAYKQGYRGSKKNTCFHVHLFTTLAFMVTIFCFYKLRMNSVVVTLTILFLISPFLFGKLIDPVRFFKFPNLLTISQRFPKSFQLATLLLTSAIFFLNQNPQFKPQRTAQEYGIQIQEVSFFEKTSKIKNQQGNTYDTSALVPNPDIVNYTVKPGDELYFTFAVNLPSEQEKKSTPVSVEIVTLEGRKEKIYKKAISDPYWHEYQHSLSPWVDKTVSVRFSKKSKSSGQKISWGSVRIGQFKRKKNELNIILISIDTLRADRLGIAGHHRNTSPTIDQLASNGIYFTQAIAESPWTLPSHISLFTGQYPRNHGVTHENQYRELDLSIPTLTEHFQARHYRTQAITASGMVAANSGLYRGFDRYRETTDKRSEANFIFEEGMKWIETHQKDKFFLFLHTYEVHSPFIHDHFVTDGMNKREKLDARYDGDIRYTDEQISRFLKKLKSLNLDRNSVVVLFSDHGEELYQRQYHLTHGHTLYDELIRIPLIFWSPHRFSPKTIDDFQAQLSDIFPTLLSLAGMDIPKNIDGRNLLSYLLHKPTPKQNIAYSSEVGYGPRRESLRMLGDTGAYKIIIAPDLDRFKNKYIRLQPYNSNIHDYLNMNTLFKPQFGFIEFHQEPYMKDLIENEGREFYNLTEDPGESTNRWTDSNDIIKRLTNKLSKIFERQSLKRDKTKASKQEDADLKDRLKSLGYL